MIESIKIENYKSAQALPLELGRVNVLIGENGAGKSNILEAIALAAAAEAGKLDNEFLASRGIRVSNAKMMRSAFKSRDTVRPIRISVLREGGSNVDYELRNNNEPYSSWESSTAFSTSPKSAEEVGPFLQNLLTSVEDDDERKFIISSITDQLKSQIDKAFDNAVREDGKLKLTVELSVETSSRIYTDQGMGGFEDFLVYSPENTALRSFEKDGQIEPLGINGEGLLRFLDVLASQHDKTAINSIKDALCLFDWFNSFEMKKKRSGSSMEIIDHFLDSNVGTIDQRSANEGFLFVAFYFALMVSSITPRFFAIDNIDTALNPKLCEKVMSSLVKLAKLHDKQVILTTHNPAVLDGLDLNDDEQRLFVISRTTAGKTRARRFTRKPARGQPTRLSELFLRGALGGLPKGF